jgi:hypothetical protein
MLEFTVFDGVWRVSCPRLFPRFCITALAGAFVGALTLRCLRLCDKWSGNASSRRIIRRNGGHDKSPPRRWQPKLARGVSVEVYVQEILARQALDTTSERRLQSVRAAIERISDLRKGNKLAGLRTKDLIHEGHKY